MCCVCSKLIEGGMWVNVWMCTRAFWNPLWSFHPLGIASILSSIVRKQTCFLICVAHCNELAKYGKAFRKKRESPPPVNLWPLALLVPCSCAFLSDMETAENLFGCFYALTLAAMLDFSFFFKWLAGFVGFVTLNTSNTPQEAQEKSKTR